MPASPPASARCPTRLCSGSMPATGCEHVAGTCPNFVACLCAQPRLHSKAALSCDWARDVPRKPWSQHWHESCHAFCGQPSPTRHLFISHLKEDRMDYVKPADVVSAMVDAGSRKLMLAPRDLLIRGA